MKNIIIIILSLIVISCSTRDEYTPDCYECIKVRTGNIVTYKDTTLTCDFYEHRAMEAYYSSLVCNGELIWEEEYYCKVLD